MALAGNRRGGVGEVHLLALRTSRVPALSIAKNAKIAKSAKIPLVLAPAVSGSPMGAATVRFEIARNPVIFGISGTFGIFGIE